MIRRLAAALLLCGTPAICHRLDEYLQATIVAVGKGQVRAEMTLTPGVAVADFVIRTIDRDGDGAISAAEQRAYAARLLADLTLTIDGRRLAPRVISTRFPGVGEMREGRGEIQMEITAELPRGGRERKLMLVNRHASGIAAYEVNCLAAEDPRVRIGTQKRNYSQSVYELDYEEAGSGGGAGLMWLAPLGLLLMARLAMVWRGGAARLLTHAVPGQHTSGGRGERVG